MEMRLRLDYSVVVADKTIIPVDLRSQECGNGSSVAACLETLALPGGSLHVLQ